MPRKVRTNKRRSGANVTETQARWLAGEEVSCFFECNHDGHLDTLFAEHGDTETMFWRRGMCRPITLQELEQQENAWLGTGEGSEWVYKYYFVNSHYSPDERRTLWDTRGEKDSHYWQPGMSRAMPIENANRRDSARDSTSVLFVNGDGEVTGFGPG